MNSVSTTMPINPVFGDVYYDEEKIENFIWNGHRWVEMVVQGIVQESQISLDELGNLTKKEIINCLKEKYPERFI